MKINPKPLSLVVLITPLLSSLLGAYVGLNLGYYFSTVPLRRQKEISSFQGAKSILYVDANFMSDINGDILYVASENGTVFSNRLSQNEWHVASSIPEKDREPNLRPCPSSWGISIKSNMIDSAGVSETDGETTMVARCYVLFSDGSMKGWTLAQSTFIAPYIILVFGGGGFIVGGIVGVIVTIFIWRKT